MGEWGLRPDMIVRGNPTHPPHAEVRATHAPHAEVRAAAAASLEARTTAVRPSRLGFAEHLRMRRWGMPPAAPELRVRHRNYPPHAEVRAAAEASLEARNTAVRPSRLAPLAP